MFSASAQKSLEKLSLTMQQTVVRKIRLLIADAAHPSLKVHKLNANLKRWECYISDFMRLIYEFQEGTLIVYELGGHQIVDSFHLHRKSTYKGRGYKKFILEPDPEPVSADLLAEYSPSSSLAAMQMEAIIAEKAQSGSNNHFAFFQDAHLRMLGVPVESIPLLKAAPDLETALAFENLSDRTRGWLEEISTSPEFADVVSDSMRLLYRTTLDRLEGYCEGKIKRLMLNLQRPEHQQYVDQERAHVVILKGAAGSGKTTIGIYRAIRCAGQGRRVLFVTFNQTLSRATRALIRDLTGGSLPGNLRVTSFHQLIYFLLEECGCRPDKRGIKTDSDLLPLVKGALNDVRRGVSSPVLQREPQFFLDEFKYIINALGLKSLEEYKVVERYGRKIALSVRHRVVVWQVYEAYVRRLKRAGSLPAYALAAHTLHALETKPPPAFYDEIVIDEAQDLTMIDLQVIRRLVTPARSDDGQPGHVMILTDAAQAIYSRGFSWKQVGIQARGHTAILNKNYRNTRQIAEAATRLIGHNQLLRQEYVMPLSNRRQGTPPLLLTANSAYNQVELVTERICQLLGEQIFRLADIAVISPTMELCERCYEMLRRKGLRAVLFSDEKFQLLEEEIKILTIHAAKGLEFPLVFLLGLVEGVLPARAGLQTLRDEDELALFLEQQRSLFYVGMTRAAEALFLLTVEGEESRFLKDLDGKFIRQ